MAKQHQTPETKRILATLRTLATKAGEKPLTDAQALAAIKKMVRLMHEVNRLITTINTWFERRYGHSYNDIDCDTLIDSLDYGRGTCPGDLETNGQLMRRWF